MRPAINLSMSTILAGGVLAMAAMAATANGGTVSNGNNATVTLGGNVNKAMLFADDGGNSRLMVVDNENDGTMFFIKGAAAVGEWKAGFYFANLLRGNPSNAVSLDDTSAGQSGAGDSGVGPSTFTERNAEISFAHPRYGKFTLGQGETSSDGGSEVDLSGTNVIGYSQVSDVAGAVKFRTAAGAYGPAIGDVSDNLDGNDRADRVRYDTPAFGGFAMSTSFASGGGADVALSFAGKIGAVEVNSAVAYFNQSSISATADDGVNGSISFLHDSGLNLTVAAGSKDQTAQGRKNQKFHYGKLGYTAQLSSLGATHFAVDVGRYADIAQNGDTMETVGLQAVQDIEDVGSKLYIGYRHYSLDRTGNNFDGISVVMAGAQIAF